GRVTQETTPTGTIQYQYDLLGRKTLCRTVVSTVPTDILTEITYTYDLFGRLSTVNTVKRDGAIVDSNGAGAGTPPESTTYFYDLLGRPDYTLLPNGVIEDYTFDAMDRVDLVAHRRASDNAVLASYDYTYRADGKRTGLNESFSTTTARSNSYTWSYDNAGRLISEVLDSSDNSVDQTESYVYDLVGNRMRKEVNKPATAYVDQIFAYNYDANDRITSETLDNGVNGAGVDQTTTYGWTQMQQTSKTVSVPSVSSVVQSMSYGLGGQLERVVTTTSNGSGTVTGRSRVDYRYTPQGIRTISIDWNDANLDGTFAAGDRTGSVEYLIENANFTGYQQTILEVTKNAAGQATKRISYTFGVDEITQTVSQIDPSSQLITQSSTLTFAHDGKGSVRALFGAAAAIAQVFTYSAYGELLAIHNGSGTLQPLASSLTSVLYNGEGLDARTGLYNMRARWYSASNARWERLDPFNGNPSDPFSFNKYGFVHGDPVMGIDPTGLSWLDDLSFRGTLAHISFSAWAKGVRPHTNPGASLRDLFGIITGALAPDLVDKVSKEFFELKPVSHRSSSLANADDLQMWSYEVYFGLFHPGEGYKRGNQSGLVPYSPGGMPIGVMTEGNTTAVLMVWPSPDQIGTVGNMRNGSGFIHYEWVPLPKVPRTRQEPIFRDVPVMVTEKVIEGKPIRYETWDPIFQPLIPHQIIILNTQSMGLATGAFIGGAILAMAGFATMNSMMGGFA
ncbi:MAG: RHS repeat-associated core domain-containing protein, partial [Planctomycetota bacterium]